MNVAVNAENLLDLARSRTPADRERLLLSVIDLCDRPDAATLMGAEPVQALLGSILLRLVAEAERDIRKRLAEKLADADWAPASLVNVLALDDIEIARPIIAASPVLRDADLLGLLVEATIEHQIEVARRPKLGTAVVDAILGRGEPAVLAALANNLATPLAEDHMRRLVQEARRVAALRAPLTRRPELTTLLAEQLYVWVGQTLRQALADRFRLDPERMDAALAEAVSEAYCGVAGQDAAAAVDDDTDQRLIAKLQAAGQLRPSYLLRALREERLSLFAAALATLGEFKTEQVARALDAARPDLLALACAAVGIDRSAFPAILELVRALNGGRPGGGAEGARRAAGAFGPFSPEIAKAAFRQAAGAV